MLYKQGNISARSRRKICPTQLQWLNPLFQIVRSSFLNLRGSVHGADPIAYNLRICAALLISPYSIPERSPNLNNPKDLSINTAASAPDIFPSDFLPGQ